MTNDPTLPHILSKSDSSYPQGVLQLPKAPSFMYASGTLETLKQPLIAILGTREPSRQGVFNSAFFGKRLAEHGFCICAGISEGVAALALSAAIKTGMPNATLGVCASGLNLPYPKKLTGLSTQIQMNGLLISEYPKDTLAFAKHFHDRNRILASICQAVLVIETSAKSSSFFTASLAAELGKEVFAIPGNIHESSSHGAHKLIKQGAKLVETIDDILEDFPLYK